MFSTNEAIKLLRTRISSAVYVGGYVRDAQLGISSDDIDIEVYNTPAHELESILHELFQEHLHTVGRQFGIYHIPCTDGTLDIALPRTESKIAPGHKGFEVTGDPTLSFEQAAKRRDFTFNAIMQDVQTGERIDPYQGIRDLEHRVLRVVDATTFTEDPLRVYRAAQFIARFDLSVEPTSLELMQAMVQAHSLAELPPERITDELKKLLLSPKPSRGFEFLKRIGAIERYFPELAALEVTPQEPEWHPEGNVWIHTMMVVDQAARIATREQFNDEQRLACVMGALCHDLGKALTTAPAEKDGVTRIRSFGHEKAGIEPTRSLFSRLSFHHHLREFCEHVAHYHLQPTVLFREHEKKNYTEKQYQNGVRTFLKKILPHDWRVFLASCEADYRGRAIAGVEDEVFSIGIQFTETVESFGLDKEAMSLLITGEELLQLGIPAGKQLGDLLRAVENERDHGHIATKDDALAFLRTKGFIDG